MRSVSSRRSRGLMRLMLLAALSALTLVASGCTSSGTVSGFATTAGDKGSAETHGGSKTVEGSGLLDSSLIHEISVSYEQEDYAGMAAAYEESGEKEWIEATVIIDGAIYDNVGLRLKGNSSLMNLRRAAGASTVPAFGDTSATGTSTAGAGAATTTTTRVAARDGWRERQGFGGPGGDASFDDPAGLPWLIDLDRNVDGQNHQGVVELCVRSNTTETALNEAVALDLLEIAGLESEQAIAVRFSVNGSDPHLRLVVENLDDVWMAREFDVKGALYKAESTGDYSYRGEDPDSYEEVFDQEAGKTNADLTPLIGFLDFINNSDDATFDAELPNRLDIEAFATYLAFEDLIANADDIDGMGNNSYLYYDPIVEKFKVVAWDHNLAFGMMGGMGGGDRPTTQSGQTQSAGQAPEGTEPPGGIARPGLSTDRLPDVPAPDTAAPDAAAPDAAIPDAGAPARGGVQLGRARSNILVERFKANPEWQQLYEEKRSAQEQTLRERVGG